MKTALRYFVAAGFALAFSFAAYSQVISPAPGSGGGSLTVPTVITGSIAGSSNHGAIGYGTLGYSDTNNFGAFQTSVNSYAQFILQNTNAGATASADYIVSNNLGTASTYYGNFGINSSGFTGTGALNQASAVYLTSTSGDLSIGTTTNNAIHFVVNSGATDTATISTAGVSIASGQPLNWNSDSGISRLGAASLAIGNGTAGDFSGSLTLTTLTTDKAQLTSDGNGAKLVITTNNYLTFAPAAGSMYGGFAGSSFFIGVLGGSVSYLTSDAANTLALRNGTNAQTLNVYNTFTDTSNYARSFFRVAGNQLQIGTEAAGTGTGSYGPMVFDLAGDQTIYFKTNTAQRMTLSSAGIGMLGNVTFSADNTYDIGASGAMPRYIKAASAIVTKPTTVASLPAAATAGAGARAYVTDATACTFGGALTGGASTNCPVVSNGTSWVGG